jgi:hypothetical protein
MEAIVTDKVARRARMLPGMIEIEMPCCGTSTLVEELTDSVGCETCGLVLELDEPATETLPVAA